MEFWLWVVTGVSALILGGGLILLIARRQKKTEEVYREEEEYEIVEEETSIPSGLIVEEEEPEGCPDNIKQKLKEQQQKLFKDAHKVYLVITNLLQNKPLPAEIKKELDTFIRSYNRIKELAEEIEVYPFSDCEKVFQLKFSFYKKLVEETARKILLVAKSR